MVLRLFQGAITKRLHDREIRRLSGIVQQVNALEDQYRNMSDEDLSNVTRVFRERLHKGARLDDLLVDAFAAVREVSRRVLGMRHFDVQIMGGVVLHEGDIAEMKTGEGKTLVATLPVYLNALTGRGVHVVTVNDYLARRDSEWMGQIYRFLGLSVGLILHGMDHKERKAAYDSDVTYGTNSEFGFDYLRDNMAIYREQLVQRKLHYAIVDEVDSILIDEARTPLIISGPSAKSPDLYYRFAHVVRQLREGEDFEVDEKARAVTPTEKGIAKVERALGVSNLYEDESTDLSHYLNQALRARCLMKRDRDYVVKDGQVIIVDEFTGRLMFGRRYSDGLHQAIEAKEGVKIEREMQTVATITYQNYFRMYEKLAGMTGTALTEADEFKKIYGLDVIEIPTNKPMIRVDYPDVVYTTEKAKFRAVCREIEECYKRGQPVLVGTVSIEKSELLSDMLKKRGIPHQVLNAKYHEKEAEIVALAGRRGAVTIATNMAGRGTDIVLGEGVVELGGLHIIGTERHEARRIDDQLRGRSGRQGDPGSSRFYLSLEDDLMRLFGSDLVAGIAERLRVDEDTPIEHPLLTNAIRNAQKRVENRNFDLRRRVLEYDDVMNKQREIIYSQRRKVLSGENMKESIRGMIEKVVDELVDSYCNKFSAPEYWDLDGLATAVGQSFVPGRVVTAKDFDGMERREIRERVLSIAMERYAAKEKDLGPELMRELERQATLRVVDAKWMEHLANMDDLREGIGLRAYGQRDPLIEYQIEAHQMFQNMISSIQEDIVKLVFRARVVTQPAPRQTVEGGQTPASTLKKGERIGRNDPCPCGSGKKYKKCCGR
ncbi:MAG: preprotein translocase subunit SecA [Bacillota bacterium]